MKLRRTLIYLGLLVAVAVLISILRHFQLRARTNAYIAALRAQGEPMDLAQVLPPHLSLEENSAETVRRAAVLIKADQSLLTNDYAAMKIVAPGKAMIGSKQPAVYGYDTTNSWKEVDAAVVENKALFPLLHSLIEKPKCDFGFNYGDGITKIYFTNFCLAESKHAAGYLQVAALNDLYRGDSASAVTNARAMLAIAKGMSDERLIVSELVRMSIVHMAMAASWEILQSTNVIDEQLGSLQNDWAGLEFFRSEENALAMERASGAITIEKWRSSNSALIHDMIPGEAYTLHFEGVGLDALRLKARVFCWRYWWSYPDHLRSLKGYQALLSAPRGARTNGALLSLQQELDSNVLELCIPDTDEFSWNDDPMETDLHGLLSSSIITLERSFNRVLKVEVARECSIAAIALKRYQLKHHAYPANLAELTPEFLSEVPRDPIDNLPLRYRLNADGTFLLYSVGDDGVDDGGNPTSLKDSNSVAWQRGRDSVWPQPATSQEVQNYSRE